MRRHAERVYAKRSVDCVIAADNGLDANAIMKDSLSVRKYAPDCILRGCLRSIVLM